MTGRLKDTFRAHEGDVPAVPDLLPGVRARVRRTRNRRRAALAVCAVLLVIAGIAVPRPGGGRDPGPVRPLVVPAPPLPAGWRVAGTQNAQIHVPAGWTTNHVVCGAPKGPTVITNLGAVPLCGTVESPSVEYADFRKGPAVPDGDPALVDPVRPIPAARPVTIAGLPAQRAEGALPSGLFGGRIFVPSQDLTLWVQTASAERTRTILDSLHFVDTDANGCPTRLNAVPRTPTGPVPQNPASLALCLYLDESPLLTLSTTLDAAEARTGAAILARSRPATPADAGPGRCYRAKDRLPSALLIFESLDGTRSTALAYLGTNCRTPAIATAGGWLIPAGDDVFALLRPLRVGIGFGG